MMDDHTPAPLDALEDIGGNHLADLNRAFCLKGDVFIAYHPGHVAPPMYYRFANVDGQGPLVLKNPCPTLADGRPAAQPVPAGMDALGGRIMMP